MMASFFCCSEGTLLVEFFDTSADVKAVTTKYVQTAMSVSFHYHFFHTATRSNSDPAYCSAHSRPHQLYIVSSALFQ